MKSRIRCRQAKTRRHSGNSVWRSRHKKLMQQRTCLSKWCQRKEDCSKLDHKVEKEQLWSGSRLLWMTRRKRRLWKLSSLLMHYTRKWTKNKNKQMLESPNRNHERERKSHWIQLSKRGQQSKIFWQRSRAGKQTTSKALESTIRTKRQMGNKQYQLTYIHQNHREDLIVASGKRAKVMMIIFKLGRKYAKKTLI